MYLIVTAFKLVILSLMRLGRLSWWLSGKESAAKAGDPGSIPRVDRSRGEENGNSLQHSRLGNSMDRAAWRATVHGVTKGRT